MSRELTDLDAADGAAGDQDAAAEPLWEIGAVVAGAVPIEAGMSVLDVATGAGSAAIHAAQAGAEVTGLDVCQQQLEGARRRAGTEGVHVAWVEGDLEALPYDDDSFDRVLSTFGTSFAARPDVAASELVRVCRPGGEVVMANWCPEGFGGRLAATLGSHRAGGERPGRARRMGHVRARAQEARRPAGARDRARQRRPRLRVDRRDARSPRGEPRPARRCEGRARAAALRRSARRAARARRGARRRRGRDPRHGAVPVGHRSQAPAVGRAGSRRGAIWHAAGWWLRRTPTPIASPAAPCASGSPAPARPPRPRSRARPC